MALGVERVCFALLGFVAALPSFAGWLGWTAFGWLGWVGLVGWYS